MAQDLGIWIMALDYLQTEMKKNDIDKFHCMYQEPIQNSISQAVIHMYVYSNIQALSYAL